MDPAAYNRPVRVLHYLAASLAVGLAIAALELVGPSVNGATAVQVLLLVLLLAARFCGTGPALFAAVWAALGFSRYFVTPRGFAFGDPNDWAALAAFVIVAIVGGELASRAERRAAEAQRQREEIERLYRELQTAFDRASEAEAARRNEELKAALLDALTHNLRTPLTAIKAAVTALIGAETWQPGSGLTGEGQHELLEIIDEESDRLNRFIEGLSPPAAAAVGPARPREVRIDDIVHAGIARAEAITRDHRVVLRIEDGVPLVPVDRAAVTEVLYILLDNASKYAPAGTTIHINVATADNEHVRIDVGDEGPGIPAELRERVFEKFFRIPGREPADPHRAGIGLGLPIARRLIEAQGGRLWIERPASSRGTTVTLVLPVLARVEAPEDSPAPVAAG